MRILLTGGGTGGHFYPLIAVARSLREICQQERIGDVDIIYASDDPYDAQVLREDRIRFLKIPAGKIRRYFSIQNVFDPFKSFFGIIKAAWILYLNLPDVIFSKGGYASFPTLVAARFFGVPIVIHETDSVPGRVTLWASHFAKRIAISYPETIKFFPKERTAFVGNPIRKEVLGGTMDRAKEIFDLESELPVIFVFGGSQGSQKINESILDILPELLEFSQIIHQTGKDNIASVKERAKIVLERVKFPLRYHPIPFLDEETYKNAYVSATLIIARSGGSIFEIAAMARPSILIPLPTSANDHQRENAYSYARTGAAEVIEEQNMTPHILLEEIKKLFANPARLEQMRTEAKAFAKLDAADNIAIEIIRVALAHK